MKAHGFLIFFVFLLAACGGGETDNLNGNNLVSHSVLAAGEQCANGGINVDSGIDTNDNQLLDADEITNSEVICNGEAGKAGVDGQTSLFNIVNLDAGDGCTGTGYRVDTGIDSNNNGSLDDDEVKNQATICNGVGIDSLVSIVDEPPGTNCSFGGKRLLVGPDSNGDGILNDGEIDNTTFLCEEKADSFDGLVYVVRNKMINTVSELYQVRADGSQSRRVDIGPSNTDFFDTFKISPDTKRVAYIIYQNDTIVPLELHVSSLIDDSQPKKISVGLEDDGTTWRKFEWSPDSEKIAFIADKIPGGDNTHLYTTTFDGGNTPVSLQSIVTNLGSVLYFSWSPDGNYLAYAARVSDGSPMEIRTVGQDGLNDKKISTQIDVASTSEWLEWSPDGAYVAYHREGAERSIYISPPGGVAAAKKLSADLNLTQIFWNWDLQAMWSRTWSPTSTHLAFTVATTTPDVNELYVSDLDEATPPVLVSKAEGDIGSTFNYFAWSPDGQRLAFLAGPIPNAYQDIYVVDRDGQNRIRLTHPGEDGMRVKKMEWTPDGSKIVYLADHEVNTVDELFVAYADDSAPSYKISGELVLKGDVADFTLSSDGNKLAFVADKDVDEKRELYVVDIDGKNLVKVSGEIPANADILYWGNQVQWSGKFYEFVSVD